METHLIDFQEYFRPYFLIAFQEQEYELRRVITKKEDSAPPLFFKILRKIKFFILNNAIFVYKNACNMSEIFFFDLLL